MLLLFFIWYGHTLKLRAVDRVGFERLKGTFSERPGSIDSALPQSSVIVPIRATDTGRNHKADNLIGGMIPWVLLFYFSLFNSNQNRNFISHSLAQNWPSDTLGKLD